MKFLAGLFGSARSGAVGTALGSMSRVVGVLVLVVVLYAVLAATDRNAVSRGNLQDLAQRQALFGVMTLGAGVLIVSGGIDLSIGSVVGLSAVTFAMFLKGMTLSLAGIDIHLPTHPVAAVAMVLGGTLVIGLIHGLLVTKLRLQPFLVTLCGLFIYRGVARQLSPQNVGLADARRAHLDEPAFQRALDFLQELAVGKLGGVPTIMLLLLGLALVLGLVLHGSVYGRYLYAIGYNEQAARYAGIATDRYKIAAYMLCSALAGLAGVLLMLEIETANPATVAPLYELYAITGAVLGGCSLRGGEGTVVGMVLGAAVLPVLRNLIIFARAPDAAEYTIIGLALLLGTIVDEMLRRRVLQTLFGRLLTLLRGRTSRAPP